MADEPPKRRRARRGIEAGDILSGRARRLPALVAAEAAARSIAARHRADGGSTFNLYVGDLSGLPLYAVSLYPERSIVLRGRELNPRVVAAFVDANMDLLRDPRNSVGTWFNEMNGLTYLDVSATLPSMEEAITLGRRYNQVAIFDLQRLEEMEIGGTGEEVPDLPPITQRLPALPGQRRRRQMRDDEG
jgi:hypothetical protein